MAGVARGVDAGGARARGAGRAGGAHTTPRGADLPCRAGVATRAAVAVVGHQFAAATRAIRCAACAHGDAHSVGAHLAAQAPAVTRATVGGVCVEVGAHAAAGRCARRTLAATTADTGATHAATVATCATVVAMGLKIDTGAATKRDARGTPIDATTHGADLCERTCVATRAAVHHVVLRVGAGLLGGAVGHRCVGAPAHDTAREALTTFGAAASFGADFARTAAHVARAAVGAIGAWRNAQTPAHELPVGATKDAAPVRADFVGSAGNAARTAGAYVAAQVDTRGATACLCGRTGRVFDDVADVEGR
jgi:hypothetical protein